MTVRHDAWIPMCFGQRCTVASVCCQACPCKADCASLNGCTVPPDLAGAAKMDALRKAPGALSQRSDASGLSEEGAQPPGGPTSAQKLAAARLAMLVPGLSVEGRSAPFMDAAHRLATSEPALQGRPLELEAKARMYLQTESAYLGDARTLPGRSAPGY